jgi:50S ribosomal subunit-associated GTPase HflX
VIDAAVGEPGEAFRAIDGELGAYGAGLDELPQIVVLNKVDLLAEPPELGIDDSRVRATFRVSCATGEGIEALRRALFELVEPAPVPATADEEGLVEFLVYRPRSDRPAYRILRTDRGFRVTGAPPEGEELEAALRSAGVREGDEVEFE